MPISNSAGGTLDPAKIQKKIHQYEEKPLATRCRVGGHLTQQEITRQSLRLQKMGSIHSLQVKSSDSDISDPGHFDL